MWWSTELIFCSIQLLTYLNLSAKFGAWTPHGSLDTSSFVPIRGHSPSSCNTQPQNTEKLISQDCGGVQSSYFAGSKSLYESTFLQSLMSGLFMVLWIFPPLCPFEDIPTNCNTHPPKKLKNYFSGLWWSTELIFCRIQVLTWLKLSAKFEVWTLHGSLDISSFVPIREHAPPSYHTHPKTLKN